MEVGKGNGSDSTRDTVVQVVWTRWEKRKKKLFFYPRPFEYMHVCYRERRLERGEKGGVSIILQQSNALHSWRDRGEGDRDSRMSDEVLGLGLEYA